jgi:hypothetical protein
MVLGKGMVRSIAAAAVLISGGNVRPALPQERTVNMMDGTVWPHLTEQERLVAVQGYVDGRRAGFSLGKFAALEVFADVPGAKGVRTTNAKNKEDPFSGDKFPLVQLTEGIDECYKDFRNQRLPLDVCYLWTVRGIQGASDADREKYLEDLRKVGDKQQ